MSLLLRARSAGGGYDYGNARVRAMHASLLDRAAYDRLVGQDAAGMLAVLGTGPYEQDVQAALARASGLSALDRAVSENLARTLRSVAEFYDGGARWAVDLMGERWDVTNAVTILRARARDVPVEEVLPLLVPAGRMDAVAAAELASQRDVASTVALMVRWGVPRPEVAAAARSALRLFELAQDPAVLERAVLQAWAEAATLAVEKGPSERRILAPVLFEEIDRRHLMVALRIREARRSGEPAAAPAEAPDLALGTSSGLLDAGLLGALARVPAAQLVEPALGRAFAPGVHPLWRASVHAFDGHGDLAALERDLETLAARAASNLWRRADPLGVAVPVGFVLLKENEARNLRLLGHAALTGLAPAAAREELLVPGD